MNKLLIVIAIIGWSIWSFTNKIVVDRMHPSVMQITNYIVGFISIPIFLWLIKRDTQNQTFDMSGIWIAIVGSICGLIAYACFTFALKSSDIGMTSAICSIYPVFTFILAVIFLGEQITTTKIIGILTVLGGVFILTR